ncbi:hypothetical protein Hanom_Chr02g00134931 [Helianthus anomalus]
MMKGSTGTIFFQKKMRLDTRSWHKLRQNQRITEKEVWHRENIKKIHDAYKEAKKAKRWDLDRECYLDSKGNIYSDPKSIDFKALVTSIPPVEEQIKIDAEERAKKERLRQERYEEFRKSKKCEMVDEGIIDVKAEMTPENLMKMADQVMMAKALEVDSKSTSES